MFVNLHTLPRGKAMYTIALTEQPAGTPSADLFYDEVDVVADAWATVDAILAAADLDGYEHCRVIGVVNQSDGFIVVQDEQGDLR